MTPEEFVDTLELPEEFTKHRPDWWIWEVAMGCRIGDIINNLSKKKGEEHEKYVRAMKGNLIKLAKRVKLDAGREENFRRVLNYAADIERFPFISKPTGGAEAIRIKRAEELLRLKHNGNFFNFQDQCYGLLEDDELFRFDDVDKVAGKLAETAVFPGKENNWPPRFLSKHLTAMPKLSGLPRVNGISNIPVLSRAGHLVMRAGYDADSEWILIGEHDYSLPNRVTKDDVRAALEVIHEPFQNFPFVGKSWAGVVAGLLDQIVLPYVNGPRPLFVFEAPEDAVGTGKSLAAEVTLMLGNQQDAGVTSWPSSEAELEKRVMPFLRDGYKGILLDNVSQKVDSATLAGVITGKRFRARELGQSKIVEVANTASWFLTMNGGNLAKDFIRRTVMVSLDAGRPDAFNRPQSMYAIKDLKAWAETPENQRAVMRALLILVQNWIQAGRPEDPDFYVASFEGWSHVVGGILRAAGVDGLIQCVQEAQNKDLQMKEFKEFLPIWFGSHPGEFLRAAEVAELALRAELLTDLLGKYQGKDGDLTSPGKAGKSIAMLMKPYTRPEHVIEGYKIIKERESKTKPYKYAIKSA